MKSAVAQAQPNIALVKYWGKRDARLNLPAAGSLSVTLDALHTRTEVSFDGDLAADELIRESLAEQDGPAGDTGGGEHHGHDDLLGPPGLPRPPDTGGGEHHGHDDAGDHTEKNGSDGPGLQTTVRPHELARVSACLDLLRARAGVDLRARVRTRNSFPTGAGLASSASGFAALVLAGSAALGLDLDPRELSVLARQGSGSAARSIFGGFVEMAVGSRPDGEDCFAAPLLNAQQWPLSVVVAVTSRTTKSVSSSAGMDRSRDTSPFYRAWIEAGGADLAVARQAVAERDFAALARVSEHSCLKMHATMLSSEPGLIYWIGATVDCLHRIRDLRERDGVGVFFTVDAGPQVKAVCLPGHAERVAQALRDIPGVQSVLTSGLGQGARLVPDFGER